MTNLLSYLKYVGFTIYSLNIPHFTLPFTIELERFNIDLYIELQQQKAPFCDTKAELGMYTSSGQ